MQVTVPAGVQPGMKFVVNTPGGPMEVECPPGASAGAPMIVNVPAAPVPMATPIMAAPVPMVMAAPVGVGAPQMGTVVASTPAVWYDVNITLALDQWDEFAKKRRDVPPPLVGKGVTMNEWTDVMNHLETFKKAHFFYSCPTMECVYFCVPGACFQCCLCLCNPITWALCICPVESAKKPCLNAVNAILEPKGVSMRIKESWDINEFGGEKAVFSQTGSY